MANLKNIQRDQRNIDRHLRKLSNLDTLNKPSKGWIRTIREALGMTAEQLGRRMLPAQNRKKAKNGEPGISGNSVLVLERNEAKGSITLDTLERAADALDCTLVYALIPKTELSTIFDHQVEKKFDKVLSETRTTMNLEDQSYDELLFQKINFANDLAKRNSIWD